MANIGSMQIVLTGLTDSLIATLQGSLNPVTTIATYQATGASGNLADLVTTEFVGTVTLRPVDATSANHRGAVLSLVEEVISGAFTGWIEG